MYEASPRQRAILKRYPRLAAHLICASLGSLTPAAAASHIAAYQRNPRGGWLSLIQRAIQWRHNHRGMMQDQAHALGLVRRCIRTGLQPILSSWM